MSDSHETGERPPTVERDRLFTQGLDAFPTYFAPPHRSSRAEIEEGVRALAEHQLVSALLESANIPVMVLDARRQILAANRSLLATIGVEDPEAVIGMRPGEAAGCAHAWDTAAGCGTSRTCSTCGAGQAIHLGLQDDVPVERDCQLLTEDGDAFDLAVRATPMRVGERRVVVVAFRDVGSELRREALERTFFHDVLNTVGGVHGWGEVLRRSGETRAATIGDRITDLAGQLTREIMDHRDLLEAEAGRLELEVRPVPVGELLDAVRSRFEGHDLCRDRHLEVGGLDEDWTVDTDPTLAVRVLSNMVKNALEATPVGGTARLAARRPGSGGCRLEVSNPGRIPDDVALQIFRRSFSTKGGRGRGLGTYSMKLFGERYLGGSVDFSTGDDGTTFRFDLP